MQLAFNCILRSWTGRNGLTLSGRTRIMMLGVLEVNCGDKSGRRSRFEKRFHGIRDRDAIFGEEFVAVTKSMGIEEVVTAPRSPWQNPYVERLIGSIRRECLDHVIVWNETSLRRTLRSYFHYYQKSRTHLAL